MFIRTRHGNLWRFRADLPHAAVCQLARLAAKEAPLAEAALTWALASPPERIAAWRGILSESGGESNGEAGAELHGWAFRSLEALQITLPQQSGLLSYEAAGACSYMAPAGDKAALEAALDLGLELFAEVYELGA